MLSLVMSVESSAIVTRPAVLSGSAGLWWGLLGVVAFSFTMPFTRIAVGGLSPLFIGSGRAVIAAGLAVVALSVTRQSWPSRRQWARLAIVAGGVVIGFPLLTSYALTMTPASHGAVVVGTAARRDGGARGAPRSRDARPFVLGVRRRRGRRRRGVRLAAGRRTGATALVGSAAVRRGARRRDRLRRRRSAVPRTRLLADRVVGPGAGRTADDHARRDHGQPDATDRHAGPVGRLRLSGRDQHVPGLLRLVSRAGHRTDGPGQSGAA